MAGDESTGIEDAVSLSSRETGYMQPVGAYGAEYPESDQDYYSIDASGLVTITVVPDWFLYFGQLSSETIVVQCRIIQLVRTHNVSGSVFESYQTVGYLDSVTDAGLAAQFPGSLYTPTLLTGTLNIETTYDFDPPNPYGLTDYIEYTDQFYVEVSGAAIETDTVPVGYVESNRYLISVQPYSGFERYIDWGSGWINSFGTVPGSYETPEQVLGLAETFTGAIGDFFQANEISIEAAKRLDVIRQVATEELKAGELTKLNSIIAATDDTASLLNYTPSQVVAANLDASATKKAASAAGAAVSVLQGAFDGYKTYKESGNLSGALRDGTVAVVAGLLSNEVGSIVGTAVGVGVRVGAAALIGTTGLPIVLGVGIGLLAGAVASGATDWTLKWLAKEAGIYKTDSASPILDFAKGGPSGAEAPAYDPLSAFQVGEQAPAPKWEYNLDTGVFRWLDPATEHLFFEAATALGITDAPVPLHLQGDAFASDDDYLVGAAGNDQIAGGAGTDVAAGGAGADSLSGDAGADALLGEAGDDSLAGGIGNDSLDGGQGNDQLDGGAGNDIMRGGDGNDLYVVDSLLDSIIEIAGNGTDGVRSAVSFTLPDHVEQLELTGTGAINGTGNALANTLVGNGAANVLDGGAGADIMRGGAGSDTYVVDMFSDEIEEAAGAGNDTVRSSASYVLRPNLENLVLVGSAITGSGNELSNRLTGSGLANQLYGEGGNDTIDAGAGNDYVEAGENNDVVLGGDGNDLIYGGGGNDRAEGGAGNDVIRAEAGTDILIGGDGTDILTGGSGDDQVDGGAGLDRAAFSYNATAGIKVDLDIQGVAQDTGQGLDVLVGIENASGTRFDDRITGNGDANYLWGGSDGSGVTGNDIIKGEGGDDLIEVGTGNHELDGGDDIDTLWFGDPDDITPAGVSVSLALKGPQDTRQGTMSLTGFENLGGSIHDDILTGDDFANTLAGDYGTDRLIGGGGNDLLFGDGYYGGGGEAAGTTAVVEDAATLTFSGNDVLDGGSGADRMVGGYGDDSYFADDLGDVAVEGAGAGTDSVQSSVTFILGANVENLQLTGAAAINGTGNSLANNLTGNGGANQLNGGGGADTMRGGAGNDVYIVGDAGDKTLEAAGEGTDTVRSSVTFTLALNIENLILFGTASVNGAGNALDNALTGNAGNNVLNGLAGADTMSGGLGNDTYVVDNALDKAIESDATGGTDTVQSAVSFALGANLENLILTGAGAIDGAGNGLANTLTGNGGANRLDGGAGADTMIGRAGDDTYVVDAVADRIVENAGEGTDTIESSLAYVLGANFENLTLTGTLGLSATGNASDNVVTGNAGANRLDGAAGADVMRGRGGGDVYYVDNVGDLVEETLAEDGIDLVYSNVSFTLGAFVDKLVLTGTAADGTGNALANQLTGNASANRLDGGAGADVMWGGAGDDVFIADHGGDRAIEFDAQGTDRVEASATYQLGAFVENLVLTGVAAINGTGNGLRNEIAGNAAANILNGSGGADTMRGGAGDDRYVVDNAGDQAIETGAADGTDSITSSVSFALGDFVENLTLMGIGVAATGNDLDNFITGNDGANRIDGKAGADLMRGNGGNDSYVVDNVGDRVVEIDGGGTDLVSSSVSFALAGFVENLTLTGGAAINGTGNGLANYLIGNEAANVLDGKAGADTMRGGAGNDTYIVDNVGDRAVEAAAGDGADMVQSSVSFSLAGFLEDLTLTGAGAIDATGNSAANALTGNNAANLLNGMAGSDTLKGGGGADGFLFTTALGATNVDAILDLQVGVDDIVLENAVFTGLAVGALAAGAFRTGAAAVDADDRILYDIATGALYFDSDGNGAAAAVQFATVTAGLVVSETEFVVI